MHQGGVAATTRSQRREREREGGRGRPAGAMAGWQPEYNQRRHRGQPGSPCRDTAPFLAARAAAAAATSEDSAQPDIAAGSRVRLPVHNCRTPSPHRPLEFWDLNLRAISDTSDLTPHGATQLGDVRPLCHLEPLPGPGCPPVEPSVCWSASSACRNPQQRNTAVGSSNFKF